MNVNRLFLIGIMLLISYCSNLVYGQKYDFVNFGIEHGLVQSQVTDLTIDHKGFIWMSTQGGVSRFDGSHFENFDYSKGLKRSFSNLVFTDLEGTIWISAGTVLQYINKNKLEVFSIDLLNAQEGIINIKQTADSTYYFLTTQFRVLQVKNKIIRQISPEKQPVLSIESNKNKLYGTFFKKGIYSFANNAWSTEVSIQDTSLAIKQLINDQYSSGLYAISNKGLYHISNNKLLEVPGLTNKVIFSFLQYTENDLYIGTDRGAIHVQNNKAEHLGSKQGFIDNSVFKIIKDKEGNIWFGTDGNGVYRYRPDRVKIFDAMNGLEGNLIMSLAKAKDETVYVGNFEYGLYKIQNNKVIALYRNKPFNQIDKINAMAIDTDQNLWIGTFGQGLWRYNGSALTRMGDETNKFPLNIISIECTSGGLVWLGSAKGLTRIDSKNEFQNIKGIKANVFSTLLIHPDTLLVGTTTGLRLLNIHKDSADMVKNEKFDNFLIVKMIKFQNKVVLATSENGLLFWDRHTNAVEVCNEEHGLSSNMVFSLIADDHCLYTGTVNGVNKITYDSLNARWKAVAIRTGYNILGPECNQNAMLTDTMGDIWVGTTKGLYVLDSKSNALEKSAPGIYLKSIQVVSKQGDSTYYEMPAALNHTHNHIVFHVQGIHLSSVEDVRYQYYLEGVESSFSPPVSHASFIYPHLNPGDYTFKVKTTLASDPSKQSEILAYTFYISPPFYQTTWFRIVSVLSLLIAGAGLMRYRLYLKNKRIKLVEAVRRQEQLKIQQRTSEDLHDDLGNKITRLALLTDILQTKLSPNEEQQKIVSQIRENIQGLYIGTKDIIWALSPHQHSLYDALDRICAFSTDLYQESNCKLHIDPIPEECKKYKPPFEFSRNIIMICKEALHNVLKHAHATDVYLKFECYKEDESDKCKIQIRDHGIGFDMDKIKKGNGLENLQKRALRIGGHLLITSAPTKGTIIEFTSNIPRSEGSA